MSKVKLNPPSLTRRNLHKRKERKRKILWNMRQMMQPWPYYPEQTLQYTMESWLVYTYSSASQSMINKRPGVCSLAQCTLLEARTFTDLLEAQVKGAWKTAGKLELIGKELLEKMFFFLCFVFVCFLLLLLNDVKNIRSHSLEAV